MLKFGFDFHNTIDAHVDFFSMIMKYIMERGDLVYIISGPPSIIMNEKVCVCGLIKDLHYCSIFSICDYLEAQGVEFNYDENGNPWCDDLTWNSAKSEICKTLEIDFMIDDSRDYGEFFKHTTKYCLF